MQVKFEMVRYIPQWKATLEGRPRTTREVVEVEVWEHTTRGLEPLAEAFAGLLSPSRRSVIESGEVLFIVPPGINPYQYYPTRFAVTLPDLGEDDDAQKVADDYFALVRRVYREGCELATRIVKTLLELPEDVWDSPFEVNRKYADPIRVRHFSVAAGYAAAEKTLGLPEGYLLSDSVYHAFAKHQKLIRHIETLRQARKAESEEASARAQAQHEARAAEIDKAHEANRDLFQQMFLSTCTDADKARYARGFVSEDEVKARIREQLFGGFSAYLISQYKHLPAGYVCENEDCADGSVTFGVIKDPKLDADQFEDLRKVEQYFVAPEFTVRARVHWGECSCGEEIRQATALVTWSLPGVDTLSREYEIGVAFRVSS